MTRKTKNQYLHRDNALGGFTETIDNKDYLATTSTATLVPHDYDYIGL